MANGTLLCIALGDFRSCAYRQGDQINHNEPTERAGNGIYLDLKLISAGTQRWHLPMTSVVAATNPDLTCALIGSECSEIDSVISDFLRPLGIDGLCKLQSILFVSCDHDIIASFAFDYSALRNYMHDYTVVALVLRS